jgi:predicted lysophospholipase L1 biosynthesis ABC-type transport system permease subunit
VNVNPLLRALPSDKLPHVWQVCSTLLAVASMFTLCWWLSKNGLLDLAATGISFFAVTFLRMVGPSLAKRAPREFERTAGLLDTARADFAQWMSHRKLLSLSIIALVSTIAFLIGRFIASTVMAAIASPWLALAVGLALAAAVASPVLVRSIAESFRKPSDESEGNDNV